MYYTDVSVEIKARMDGGLDAAPCQAKDFVIRARSPSFPPFPHQPHPLLLQCKSLLLLSSLVTSSHFTSPRSAPEGTTPVQQPVATDDGGDA